MTDRKTRSYPYQQPAGPADPERMRDPDYVVRGYKAALYRRSTLPLAKPGPPFLPPPDYTVCARLR